MSLLFIPLFFYSLSYLNMSSDSGGKGGGGSSAGGPEAAEVAVDWWIVPVDWCKLLCRPVKVDCLLVDCCCGEKRKERRKREER